MKELACKSLGVVFLLASLLLGILFCYLFIREVLYNMVLIIINAIGLISLKDLWEKKELVMALSLLTGMLMLAMGGYFWGISEVIESKREKIK